MLVKGMFRRIYQLPNIPPERRDPVRVITIKLERELYEFISIAIRPYGLDANLESALRQIRSISRPTLRNASSTESSCDSV